MPISFLENLVFEVPKQIDFSFCINSSPALGTNIIQEAYFSEIIPILVCGSDRFGLKKILIPGVDYTPEESYARA